MPAQSLFEELGVRLGEGEVRLRDLELSCELVVRRQLARLYND